MIKILAIMGLVAASLLILIIGVDIGMGFDFRSSLSNAINPFKSMELSEMIVLLLFIFTFFAQQFLQMLKKFVRNYLNEKRKRQQE